MKKWLNSWLSCHSLKFKLNVSILSCVCVIFMVFVFLLSEKVRPIIRAQIDAIAKKTVETYVAEFAHYASDIERVLLSAKNTLSQMEESDTDSLEMVLNSAIRTVNSTDLDFANAWVYVFSPEDVSAGNLHIETYTSDKTADSFKTEHIPDFYARFPWFKEVPKEEKVYWSEPYVDTQTQKIVVTCLIPFKFKQQDDFNGLMALTLDFSDIQQDISDFTFYKTGKLMLLSRTGLYVTYPDPDVALKLTIFELAEKLKLPQLQMIGKDLKEGRSGQISVPNSPVFNDTAVFYYAPIEYLNWGICLVYAQNYLLKPVQQFQIVAILLLLICIASLLFLINWICHNSTNQLTTLGNIAEQYGKGNFEQNFEDTPSSVEIGRLAGALSGMRADLLEYIQKELREASEKQKSQSELDIARHIQKSALAVKYPDNPAFKIATMMIPARQVGGDFYDFFFIDEHKFAIVIADVSGKGIPAALYMMKALTLIRNISKSGKDLGFVFQHVNEQLCEGNDTCMFVTAFMAVIDLESGEAKYMNAGHLPPIIKNKDGVSFVYPQTNIVLGISSKAVFVEESMQLAPETHVFLYTDGVTEAENAQVKFYGNQRLLKVCQKLQDNPESNIDLVLKDVHKFVKNHQQSDDITMLDFVFYGKNGKSVTFDADITKIKEMIDYLKKDMDRFQLSEKAKFNVIMAAEEIFSNIAQYAYEKTDKNAVVTIKTKMEGEHYCLTFIDKGKKYNPLENKEPDILAKMSERAIGGLGVFLTKKLADKLLYSYDNGQNILKIYINRLV